MRSFLGWLRWMLSAFFVNSAIVMAFGVSSSWRAAAWWIQALAIVGIWAPWFVVSGFLSVRDVNHELAAMRTRQDQLRAQGRMLQREAGRVQAVRAFIHHPSPPWPPILIEWADRKPELRETSSYN